RGVHDGVKAMGLEAFSLAEFVEQIQLNVVLIRVATGVVAFIVLLVSALGIVNTLLMSVLERTREIGVMKAVGARDGHVLGLFLVEGALVGLLGGVMGTAGAWLASFPMDRVARQLVEKQTLRPIPDALFAFPWWLPPGVVAFAVLVTTLSALY